jgi:hypothetical protein
MARLLFLLAAGGLAGVVIDEHREQAASDEDLQRTSEATERNQSFELDAAPRPLPYSTSR